MPFEGDKGVSLPRLPEFSVLIDAKSATLTKKRWCFWTELNRRHENFQSSALPAELPKQSCSSVRTVKRLSALSRIFTVRLIPIWRRNHEKLAAVLMGRERSIQWEDQQPKDTGAGSGIRTHSLLITSQLRYLCAIPA